MNTIHEEISLIDRILDSTNVGEMLDDEKLNQIGSRVVADYNADKDSRSEWEIRYERCLKLAAQIHEQKTFPWNGAASIKYPLLTNACLQFSSRAYPALVPPVDVVKCRVNGFDETGEKERRAIRVGKHMSYQVLEQMTGWEEDMDRLLVMLPNTGTEFKKTWYDPSKGYNCSRHVMAKDLVVNYWAHSLEDAQRITHVMRMSKNDVRERVLKGVFLDQDLGEPNPMVVQTVKDTIQGTQDVNAEGSPFIVLEQHCWIDLDEDEYMEPYIVTVEENSQKVLRIVARFDVGGVSRNENKEILSIEPIHYFTKFSFIPSFDGGFYDMGFGHLLSPINETVNTTINQLLDSGTLSNLQGGFLARGIRLKGGNFDFDLGEWKVVDSTYDDLRKGIFPLQHQPPSQVLFQLLGMMVDAGRDIGAVKDILMGDSPGQNQPATTTLAVIEQGLKVFTAIYKRLYRSLKEEYRKIYRLNRLYLDQQEYFRVLDPDQKSIQTIQRSDYDLDDLDVIPAADPNIVSDLQRVKRAEALVASLANGSPANPLEVWRRYYEAIGIPSIGSLLPTEMPPPPPDPKLIQAQAQIVESKTRQQLDRSVAMIQARKTLAEILMLKSQTILNLAKAEAEEAGSQIDLYKANLDRLALQEQSVEAEISEIGEKEAENDQRGLPSVEGQRADQGNLPLSSIETGGVQGAVNTFGPGGQPYPVRDAVGNL